MVKRVKRHKGRIFRLNWCAIAHVSRGGPGVWLCCGPKINRACQGG